MKKIVLAMVAAALFVGLMLPPQADATCAFTGKVVYCYTTPTYAYVYLAQTTTGYNTTLYYYYVNDDTLINQLAAAMAGNDTVQVVGTATTCPTTGTYRYGGQASYCYRYKNY